jgi:uncharacterized protein YggE
MYLPVPPPGRGFQEAYDTIPEATGWRYRPKLDSTYRAREILEVRISNTAQVGAAIDTLLGMRITEISRIRFGIADPYPVQLELLREATVRATDQATAIAAASGARLGRVLYLGTEAPSAGFVRYGFDEMVTTGVEGGTAEVGTEITAPNIPVTVTVYGRWKLVRP